MNRDTPNPEIIYFHRKDKKLIVLVDTSNDISWGDVICVENHFTKQRIFDARNEYRSDVKITGSTNHRNSLMETIGQRLTLQGYEILSCSLDEAKQLL